jgi:predicted Rossmann fold nucleotide-binding protein DprA/Smf involved in DNA uptake
MRQSACGLSHAERTLRAAGYLDEAVALATPGLLAWAETRAARVLTPACRAYPENWQTRLADAAPPALWKQGDLPIKTWVGIVGSRSVGAEEEAFAREVGREAARAEYGVVSGGAVGCDTFGARGAAGAGGPVVRILPCGLDRSRSDEGAALALAAPGEPFSTALAMERNALIYAAAEGTVVVHARYRQGGTWHGAADALRRRLGPLLVRECRENPAHRALIALGAHPLAAPGELIPTLSASPLQPAMFVP